MSHARRRKGAIAQDLIVVGPAARNQRRRTGAESPGIGRLVLVRILVAVLGVLYFPAVVTEVAGDGTATFAAGRAIDSDAVDVYTLFAVDLDGDGDLDVVAAMNYWDEVFWYENVDGNGTFPQRYDVSPCCERSAPSSISAGDLNGDGSSDIIVAYELSNEITWFSNSDGLGTFSEGMDITTDAAGANWVTVVDIDGDGDLDVVSTSFYDDRITWYENTDAEGTFADGIDIWTTADGPTYVIAADLDSDGDVDILGTSYSGDVVTWFENLDGKGDFSDGVNLSDLFYTPSSLAAADLDGDLDLDVISAGDQGHLAWFENTDGAGTFAGAEGIGDLDSAGSVVTADIDNDGDIDLVVVDASGGRIVWFENTDGLATFSTAIEIAIDFGALQVLAIDIDGDGDIDILSASPDQENIILYENLLITGATVSSDYDVFTETPAPVGAPLSPTAVPTWVEEAPVRPSTPAPSVPPTVMNISEAPGTLAPGTASPLGESSSNTGDSSDKWLDAAWEIAIAVVGGVLVAIISATTVAVLVRRDPDDPGTSVRSDSGIFINRRTSSSRSRNTCDDLEEDLRRRGETR